MARRFTRQEFYDLVWSRPMTQLAKEFALSDVALHKICRKHDVPTPPVGWWARHAAGKALHHTPLPKRDDADEIIIAGADLTSTDAALAGARESARILASSGAARSAAAMHPAIGRTLVALRKGKPSNDGLVSAGGANVIRCSVAAASIDRLADVLPPILSAAAVQGFDLESSESGCQFRSATETISFSITEAIDRTPHVMSDAEKAKEAAWRKKRDNPKRRNSWSFLLEDRPAFPEWDYSPSGKLGLEFEQVWIQTRTSPRRSFKDGKTQTLESMVADIAVGLAVLAAAKTQARLEREAREQKWQDEQTRRENAARKAWVEDRRRGALDAILTELDSLDRLRRLVAGLSEDQADATDERVKAFLIWADGEVSRRFASVSASGLAARFEAERLFGEDDDKDFRVHRWS